MPLVVISGLPCSGKSSVAAALAEACRQRGQEVHVVDEGSLHLHRNDSYKDASSEKVARGVLLAAMERALSVKRRTVILDTHNNIKGYRYQLWCCARLAATRYCMVHVDTPADTCRQWNQQRPEASSYSEAIFEDLACRFEQPDSRNRWDSPLFTVRPELGTAHMQEQLEAVAAAVSDIPLPQRAAAPAQAAAQGGAAAAAGAGAAGAAAGVGPLPEEESVADEPRPLLQAKQLKPHVATDTSASKLSATNLQYEIDRAIQHVLDRVAEAQAAAGSDAPGIVTFDSSSSSRGVGGSGSGANGSGCEPLPELDMYRPVFLPELRRHKRAFMKLATNQTFMRLSSAASAQRMFITYLRDQLAQG